MTQSIVSVMNAFSLFNTMFLVAVLGLIGLPVLITYHRRTNRERERNRHTEAMATLQNNRDIALAKERISDLRVTEDKRIANHASDVEA